MNKAFFFILAVIGWGLCAPAKELLDIKGDYLLYSFDFNYVYGQGNIIVKNKEFTAQAETIEIDVTNHVAMASRNCQVQVGKQKIAADILEIDLDDLSLKFTTFKDIIHTWTLPTQKKQAEVDQAFSKKIVPRGYEALKKSLVYFLNRRIVITGTFRVYGYQSTVFVEGIQSLSFKKFKLDKGISEKSDQGFGIDKIWYYPSQGLVVNSRLFMEKATKNGWIKTSSALDLKYDIFGDPVVGSRGKINFNSVNSLDLSKKSALTLNINYLTDNMLNASLDFKTQWTPSFNSEWVAEYSRTAAKREEMWLRLRSGLNGKVLGNVLLNLSYEKEKQYLAEISLQNQAVKNFVLSVQHTSSRLLYGENQYNRLNSSLFSLSYSNKLFNLATDYSFHKDMLLGQSQSSPQFRLNMSPFRLYHGLLGVNFVSSFMVSQLQSGNGRDNFRKVNMGLSLQSEKIKLGRGPEMSFSMAAEQLIDKDPLNNFTSFGGIFKCSQSLANFADLDFLYNYHTQRKTEKWFIQGTTSQDWAAILKLKEKENRVQGLVSLSFNTKTGHFSSGFFDCAVSIVKNWQFQTQMNYDFLFKNFSYDLYLIRRAGRIMIRAAYRSLSRQFLVEVLPNQ